MALGAGSSDLLDMRPAVSVDDGMPGLRLSGRAVVHRLKWVHVGYLMEGWPDAAMDALSLCLL